MNPLLALLALSMTAAGPGPAAPARGGVRPGASLGPTHSLASGGATTAATPKPAAPPTRATACRPKSARRCSGDGCEAADEGLHAELFELDLGDGWLGACLYTDCFHGPAHLTRDPERPWRVTAFGEVHSERPEDGVPPPGSAPFPLTLSVDLRDGRFTAIWSLSPDGLQVDFGTCQLAGAEGP